MTPARNELPPEPPKTEDDYGLDDLKSDEETDDDENPKKQVKMTFPPGEKFLSIA